jgi:predicted GH43/DUF377 family glycosyl hydrolase
MRSPEVHRAGTVRFAPDPRRVIAKPFIPGDLPSSTGPSRVAVVLERIMRMSDDDVTATLDDALARFVHRHRDLHAVLDANAAHVTAHAGRPDLTDALTPQRRQLIGAFFTHEFSVEAAALGNPSIVPAPDQTGLDEGELRFVMSLRAIGEGHISSIEFRTGVVTADAAVRIDVPTGFVTTGTRASHAFDKRFFVSKLEDLGVLNAVEERVLDQLDERFTMGELEDAIATLAEDGIEPSISGETTRLLHWLASSNYRTAFPRSVELSERVLFPSGPTESHGMEDARFVRFTDVDGSTTYYATYTAFDGHQILPQLLETPDFAEFRVTTMSGRTARNKGIALFPRRIGGRFVALGRVDNVNNYLMTSNDVRVWENAAVIQEPERPWELMQLGNCGSPLETDAGWLVITHGVGPFRTYALGALLLDLDDPSQVIGHLDDPLLVADERDRDGYVPNVVYSCGSLIHAGTVVVPYGFADVGAGVATFALDDLLSRLSPRVT